MIAYLFLPKKFAPPFQTIIHFPGAKALTMRSINGLLLTGSTSSLSVAELSYGQSIRVPLNEEMISSRIIQTTRAFGEIMWSIG